MEFKRFKSENPVWGYFLRSKNGERAECETCKTKISCKGGSTGAMRNHLSLKHKILLDTKKTKQQVSWENTDKSFAGTSLVSTTSTIENYFKSTKESLERVVAELAAVDRISFNTIATSKQLRQAFLARGYKLPQTVQNVRSIILTFFQALKSDTKKMTEIKKEAGKFCSVTLDEYTSIRSRRYMNVNLHYDPHPVNLGMVRIKGSIPAERVENLVKGRLHEFGLKMEDIVAATTDGASVMKSFGRMICFVHQLCFAHGYHLAVTDFLYARRNLFEGLETEREHNTGSDSEFSSEEETEEVDETAVDLEETEAIGVELQRFVAEVIGKVRTIVKMFRKSPLKDEILQKHNQAQLNTEQKLILDSKTRWNSLLEMIKIFVKAEKCIRMALVEIGTSITITDAEIKILRDLIDVLKPVKHAVDGLSRRNATLLTAERIHDFVFKSLSNSNSEYAASFKSHLEVRIKERRNACLVHLLEYLHDPNFLMESKLDIFGEYGNKIRMYTLAVTLMQRLLGVAEPGPGEDSQFASLASTSVCRESSHESLKEELERAIMSASIPATRPSNTPNLNKRMVQKECEVFEASGRRPANLQHLYEALLTIQPTSVEAERAFSACGLFVTKLRSRLHDSTVDALCFIRNALQKQ